jgi:hypothetical protein
MRRENRGEDAQVAAQKRVKHERRRELERASAQDEVRRGANGDARGRMGAEEGVRGDVRA